VITITPTSQITTNPTNLTFTPTNWTVPQTVTVTAVDDTVIEGLRNSSITHTVASADPAYNRITTDSISVTVNDNDIGAAKRFVHFPLISR
jgi:hypothetical protein